MRLKRIPSALRARVVEQFTPSLTIDPQSFDLPFPPSVNGLTFNRESGGRGSTEEALQWKKDAGGLLNQQRPKAYTVRVDVCVYLEDSPRTKGDGDNRIKIVLDLLVAHRVIAGDEKKYVRRSCAEWSPETIGCRVSIRPAPMHAEVA
jgi:Holliday junction resolvase RusA-like endonuclease